MFLDVRIVTDFSASPELILFCMDHVGTVAKSCTTTAYLWCSSDSCSSLPCLWHAVITSPNLSAIFIDRHGFLLHGACVTFVRLHTSQFGSFGKWVDNLWFPPALNGWFRWKIRRRRDCWRWLFHVRRRDVCRAWRSVCESFREWLKTILVNLFPLVAHGRPQLVSASGHTKLGSGDGLLTTMWLWVLHSSFSHSFWDMVDDLDAILMKNRFLRTMFAAIAPRLRLFIIELQQIAYSVVWVVSFAVIFTNEPFDFRIVSCSSGVQSLLLLMWCEAPESTVSLSLFRSSYRRWRTIGLKNLCRFSEYKPGIVYTFLCLDFSGFADPVWMTPSASPIFPFRKCLFARWWSLTWNCDLSSDRTYIGLESFEFTTFVDMPTITGISLLTTSFLGTYTMLSVCISWLCAFSTSVITTFSITFRISVWWTCLWTWTKSFLPLIFLVRVMFVCACLSKRTLAFRDPTYAVSSLGVVFGMFFAFSFCFSLLGAPIAGLTSSRFLPLKWESLIYCSRCLWAVNFNQQ